MNLLRRFFIGLSEIFRFAGSLLPPPASYQAELRLQTQARARAERRTERERRRHHRRPRGAAIVNWDMM